MSPSLVHLEALAKEQSELRLREVGINGSRSASVRDLQSAAALPSTEPAIAGRNGPVTQAGISAATTRSPILNRSTALPTSTTSPGNRRGGPEAAESARKGALERRGGPDG
jgi:hypothetical protein